MYQRQEKQSFMMFIRIFFIRIFCDRYFLEFKQNRDLKFQQG